MGERLKMNSNTFGIKLKETVEFYKNLDFKQQKILLRSITVWAKKPPYYITFDLDTTGMAKMMEVITYCKTYKIPYTPEKRGNTKIAFSFKDLSARNEALIGRLTLQKEKIKWKLHLMK
jgi:hypothetical protein